MTRLLVHISIVLFYEFLRLIKGIYNTGPKQIIFIIVFKQRGSDNLRFKKFLEWKLCSYMPLLISFISKLKLLYKEQFPICWIPERFILFFPPSKLSQSLCFRNTLLSNKLQAGHFGKAMFRWEDIFTRCQSLQKLYVCICNNLDFKKVQKI